jgi:phosphoglycerol transferase MdoB-like AlkP superfamily enzyme
MQPKTVLIWSLIAESNGLIFLYNWLPVWLVMLFIYFATGNFAAACGLGTLLFFVPGFFNRYMIAMRFAPLRPFDLMLGMEFLGIARSIRPVILIALGGGIVSLLAFVAIGVRFIKNIRPSYLLRGIGATVCAFVMFGLMVTLYDSPAIHESLPLEGNSYSEADQFQSKGFVYSFLHTWQNGRITKPGYYERYRQEIETAERRTDIPPETRRDTLPNIIMILSESFSELSMSDALDFTGFDDPLRYYREIKDESVSGFLVAPHIGGGTADMEFDVLTGINTRDFRGVPYAFTMVTRPFPSIAGALSSAGYETLALHPGMGWFYNRQNVYPLMGFDNFLCDGQFDKRDTKGWYISERQTVDVILREYENQSSPSFLKAITIQNHGPYFNKYKSQPDFEIKKDLPDDDKNALANYFEGLRDSDEGLRRLVTYFSSLSEPVVLVYYGDHFPSLPLTVYEALVDEPAEGQTGEQMIRFHRVPFLIWANEAGKRYTDIRALESSMPEDRTISAFYLGAAVLEMLGLDTADPFMRFLNTELRPVYPISMENTYRGPSWPFMHFLPDETTGLHKYKSWAYYRITNP